jgi:hypothetical protein
MRRRLVHQRRSRIAPKQLRHNQQADLLILTVESLLGYGTVAVRREVDDAAAMQLEHQYSYREEERRGR